MAGSHCELNMSWTLFEGTLHWGQDYPIWLFLSAAQATPSSAALLLINNRRCFLKASSFEDHNYLHLETIEGATNPLSLWWPLGNKVSDGEMSGVTDLGWTTNIRCEAKMVETVEIPNLTQQTAEQLLLPKIEAYLSTVKFVGSLVYPTADVRSVLPPLSCFATSLYWCRERSLHFETPSTPFLSQLGKIPDEVMITIFEYACEPVIACRETTNSWGSGGGGGPSLIIEETVGQSAAIVRLCVLCGGVPVTNPKLSVAKQGVKDHLVLQWSGNSDSTRNSKPHTAELTFCCPLALGFEGWCVFPGEGSIGYNTRHDE